MRRWIEGRPVTRVEFGDDLQLTLRLSLDAGEYLQHLRRAVTLANDPQFPSIPDRAWADAVMTVAEALEDKAVGRARVDAEAQDPPQAGPGGPLNRGNATPVPAWVGTTLAARKSRAFADGSVRGKLLTARQAEADARQALRTRIDALPAFDDRRIGELRFTAGALDTLVRQAQVEAVSYRNGRVEVRLSIPGRQVWQAVRPRGFGSR
jgi:hypothetical protein